MDSLGKRATWMLRACVGRLHLGVLIAALTGCASAPLTPPPPAATASGSPAASPQEARVSVAGTAATVSAADIPLTTEEKSLLARGFHITARGDSAERIFCRREVAVGSHIASDEVCGTVRQLKELSLIHI